MRRLMNLRQILKEKNMTSLELANLSGLGEKTINNQLSNTGLTLSKTQKLAIRYSLQGHTKSVSRIDWDRYRSSMKISKLAKLTGLDENTIKKINSSDTIPTHIQRIIRHAINN